MHFLKLILHTLHISYGTDSGKVIYKGRVGPRRAVHAAGDKWWGAGNGVQVIGNGFVGGK